MIRPKLVVVNNDRDEQSRSIRDGKGFRFELSRNRLIVYALSLVLSLCFMFTLGVFVGRGRAVVKPDDVSLKGRFLRFLGLDLQTGALAPGASVTWESPKKMIQSLHYYQDLTRNTLPPLGTSRQPAEHPPAAPPTQPVKEVKAASAPKPPARQVSAAPQPPEAVKTPPPAGRYTLLVASLKAPEARALIDKLKAAGYSPFVESLEFGSTKWSRILLGSFATRRAAIDFADKFNRKEKTQAMVITGSQ